MGMDSRRQEEGHQETLTQAKEKAESLTNAKPSFFTLNRGDKCESSFAYLKDLIRISTLTP